MSSYILRCLEPTAADGAVRGVGVGFLVAAGRGVSVG
jgi:hypothetical protein